MALMPMAMYGLEVPAGDVAIPARPDIPSAFRITMAAIDPSAEPEGEEGVVPRATLKVIRQSLLDDEDDDDDDDSEFDQEQMERLLAEEYSDESDEDDEEVNGGPSDPSKSKKAKLEAAKRDVQKLIADQGMDMDEDEDEDDSEDDDEVPNGINGIAKSAKALGKLPASDEDDDEDEDMDDVEVEEFVICTLDPNKLYQQTLDITFGEDEKVWFKVSGTHSIFLTGNYVEPVNEAGGMFDPDSDEEEDYDLEPDEDELPDSEDESILDGLDDLADPRVTELDEDEEAPTLAPVRKEKGVAKKNKNKRPAADSEDEDAVGGAESLDEMIAKEAKIDQPTVNGEQKLSKKQRKKLKNNEGAAATPPVVEKVVEKIEVDVPMSSSSNKSDKKVSFAKELEQGPTPTPTKEAKESKEGKSTDKSKSAPSLGVKTVQGVTMDDKKLGSGQAAKNGDRVGMRYIGKLKDGGLVFDSNKKGKPFSFKLGAGEVIKGWEIGLQGMQAGGERRITIPAHLAYGSKKMGSIPANSALVFDVKMLEINKK